MRSLLTAIGIIVVLPAWLVSQPAPGSPYYPMEMRMIALMQEGSRLTVDQAAEIEKRLEDFSNVEDRVQLVGFYASHRNARNQQRRQEQILWLIEKHPENVVGAGPEVLRPGDPGYGQAKQIWQRYARTRNEAVIFRNSGHYLIDSDNFLAVQLLQQGEALTPGDPFWEQHIGQAYALQAKTAGLKPSSRMRYATQAVAAFERAAQLNPSLLVSQIGGLACEAALLAENWDKAREWADLASHSSLPATVHVGHWILGEVALHERNVDKAKAELLASANLPGNQDIGLYSVRMNLAEKLLRLGERDAVMTYLDHCAVFWKSGQVKLMEWSVLIKNGLDPDFGWNSRF